MATNLSKWKTLGYLLSGVCFFVLSGTGSEAATKTYTLSINSAASVVHTTGGYAGGGEGDLSVSGSFQAVVTNGVIEFRNVNITATPHDSLAYRIIPGYPGTATQTVNGYSFSGSKPYDNSTGGGNFSGSIGGTGFSMSGNFNSPCCDQYNYQFILNGTVVSVVVSGVDTTNNNFTVLDGGGQTIGGTNDVRFTWDNTRKTSVAVSSQVSNATLASTCMFLGYTWSVHDMAIYGPGTYTVYRDCPAGSPGCGAGTPITFTVGPNEIGGHILLDWSSTNDIDVVNVWTPKAVFGPSALWTGSCGSNPVDKVWDWMSKDYIGYGINGGLTSDVLDATSANFNLMETVDLCANVACPAVMVCNSPLVCDPATGQCVPQNPLCDDGNACTNDSCDLSTGQCLHAPVNCDDNNACTTDLCYPATGCVHYAVNVNDNDACTIDSCNPLTGAVFTPRVCNDNNACTTDSCDRATGCVFTPIVCNDNNACTTDFCNPATGCVFMPFVCNDNNACTADTCDPVQGCIYTLMVCNKNDACNTCTCDPTIGCVCTLIPGATKSVTIRGGGQKPTTVDLEIQTTFTVVNDGCIGSSTASTVTVAPGTALLVNFNAGQGPPTSCTWNGVQIDLNNLLPIVGPDFSGEVGKLICDNKDGGGKDVDRMTISVQ